MSRTEQLRFHIRFSCLLLSISLFVVAQSTCPPLTQARATNGLTDLGVAQSAVIDVQVVDTSNGAFDATQVQAITDAISGIAAIPGSNVNYTVTRAC